MKKSLVIILLLILACADVSGGVYIWLRMQSYPRKGGTVKVGVECWNSALIPDIHHQAFVCWAVGLDSIYVYKQTGIVLGESDWVDSLDVEFFVEPIYRYNSEEIKKFHYAGDVNENYNNVVYIASATVNEGYHFLGFSRSRYKDFRKVERPEGADENWEEPIYLANWDSDAGLYISPFKYPESSFIFNTDVVQKSNPGYMIVPSGQIAHAEIDDFMERPETPNERCYALFARIIANDAEGGVSKIENHSNELSDNTNDIGDEVCITAVADNVIEHPFLYWIEESTGRHIKENPYTFTVTDKETYTPYFGIEPNGIANPTERTDCDADAVYSIDGKRLTDEPERGIFIKDNKKMLK